MPNFQPQAAYRPRQIMPMGVWTIDQWRLKVHGIAFADRGAPPPAMVEAVHRLAAARLGDLAPNQHHHLGYLMIHLARPANYALLTWWANENTVFQATYTSDLETPTEFREISASGQVACVWEMRVHAFERESWLKNVLANPHGVDVEAYLTDTLCELA